ncbi:MAG: hypothetical protein ACXU8S_01485 [Phenylobacterium sp.]
MFEALAPSADTLPPEAANARDAERLAALRELAEIGMRLARRVVAAAEAGETVGDAALTYARIARAVRQTLALEARLEGEALEGRRRAEAERQTAQAQAAALRAEAASAPTRERRRLVSRAVNRAIEHEGEAGERMDYLQDRLLDVLNDREDDEDFLNLPIGELVAMICKDLNVDFDATLWEDETWARAEAAARAAPTAAPPDDFTPGHDAAPPRPALRPAAPSWLSG